MTDLLTLSKRILHRDEHAELQSLSTVLSQHSRTLRKHSQLSVLSELDPAHHTLAYAYYLEAELTLSLSNTKHLSLNSPHMNILLLNCNEFFSRFQSWQIHATQSWSLIWNLTMQFYHIAMMARRESAPLSSLRRTCAVLDEIYPHALTIVHAHFVVLCVRSKHYRAALSVVNRPIYSILPRSHIDPVELLNYFYFTGLIHAANKQWNQAYDSFYMCLVVPGNAVSAIQIAAHKKLVLTAIISNNDLPDFTQRSHSNNLIRSLDQANQVYLDLAKAFEKQLSQQSSSTIRQSSNSASPNQAQPLSTSLLSSSSGLAATLNADRCYGLALELDKHLFETRIQRLTRTFITLELSEMAKIVGATSITHLEAAVNRLINAGVIGARINQMTGLCKFVDQQETSEFSQHQTERLQDQISELCTVLEALQRKQHDIERNPMYIAKQLMNERGEESRSGPSNRGRHTGSNNEDWELNTAIAESLRTS